MKKKSFRDLWGNFSFLQVAFYAAHACYSPYTVVYMHDRGLSTSIIGLVMMANSIVSILMQPIWGMLCDRFRSVKKVYLACLSALCLIVPVLGMIQQPLLIALWIPMINVFFCSMFSFMDSWIVQGVKTMPGKSYGGIRVWGSVGYMIVVAISGKVSADYSTSYVFFAFSAFALLSITIAFCIQNEGVDVNSTIKKKVKLRDMNLGALLKNYHYVVFVVCVALVQIPLNVKGTYLLQRVLEAGGDNSLYGMFMSIGALSEIPVLFLSSKILRRFKASNVVRFAMVVYASQLVIYALPVPAIILLLMQLTQGCGYGLFLVGSVQFLDELAPENLKTSAYTFASAVYGGVAGIIGSSAGGFLIDSFGVMPVYRVAAIWAAFAVALYFILTKLGNKRSVRKAENQL